MIDAYQPEGITRLEVDSILMMPHLGVLDSVDEVAATDVFERDCLGYMGTCIAAVYKGKGKRKANETCAAYELRSDEFANGVEAGELKPGDLRIIPLSDEGSAQVTITPARDVDVGAGPGQSHTVTIHGGTLGVVLDARGRPLQMAPEPAARVAQLENWYETYRLYGEEA